MATRRAVGDAVCPVGQVQAGPGSWMEVREGRAGSLGGASAASRCAHAHPCLQGWCTSPGFAVVPFSGCFFTVENLAGSLDHGRNTAEEVSRACRATSRGNWLAGTRFFPLPLWLDFCTLDVCGCGGVACAYPIPRPPCSAWLPARRLSSPLLVPWAAPALPSASPPPRPSTTGLPLPLASRWLTS
jgi:hypothetical protein